MKKFGKSSKKGFTLVEMMLAIAIIMLISGLFVSLIIAVKDSFYRVYNDDDSSDYAALYAQALENQVLYDTQNGNTRTYHMSATDYILVTDDDVDSFGFRSMNAFNKNKDGKLKWRAYLVVERNADGSLPTVNKQTGETIAENTVQYTIYMVDNYYNPGQLVQKYSGSFWVPSHGSFQANDAAKLKVVDDGGPVEFSSASGTQYKIQPTTLVYTK